MLLRGNLGDTGMGKADKTRGRILDAARQILARDGFAGLGVNALAAEAGVGKPLVYRYFDNMQGVVSALIGSLVSVPDAGTDAGTDAGPDAGPSVPRSAAAAPGPAAAIDALVGYGRGLAGDRTRRDLMAWSLAAGDGPALEALQTGSLLSEIAPAGGPANGHAAQTDRQAIMALLQGAITFLLLCRDRHSQWAGMPLSEPRHMARLERAVAAIITASFSEIKVTKQ